MKTKFQSPPLYRRFGLKQKHKVRLIDDFSQSSVNQSVTVSETPVLHTIDVACALMQTVNALIVP